ncbi:DUF2798 domain-containing protein [Metasolibacillus sp.]|uniref:DUF2798 domain-containing protein n=1 Tax=Metasolibacillus sp. TaxID=2703680 RepID=UPI0025DA4075|nr:DUF2798 domain-containing protein [Metasolibacillus sp.]MCT6924541.1 DUF2798 domain-containing protein [Metasolibacillus sp.]MCT6940745.1 DUF2798 domain-containing protein [Metasolibacillus sp.]
MPTTRKESIQFSLMMCFGMVVVMTFYNFYLNGLIGEITLTEGLINFLITFMIAFILEVFLVGPIAKKVAFKATMHTTKKVYKILAISICMVIGMVLVMTLYGVMTMSLHVGHMPDYFVAEYVTAFGKNFVIALPLQILIIGPFVRYLFMKLIK